MGAHGTGDLERELSSLPPYRVPDELRRSLRARLISEAAQGGAPSAWSGAAVWRAGALAAATILLLSGVSWAVVASAPGDPLNAVRDVIARLVLPSARGVDPLPAGIEGPEAPAAVPADMPAPPSIAPTEVSDGAREPTATGQPPVPAPVTAPSVPAPVTAPSVTAPSVTAPSVPARATPAVPPSPPGPRATPAIPPLQP